jgi:Cu+-exporting ATPase
MVSEMTATAQTTAPVKTNTKQLTIPIIGMHCANCANTIGRNLKRTPGVDQANVSYANERRWSTMIRSRSRRSR